MQDIFRDIPGYEGSYQVSNLGRVRSYARTKERILKLKECFGYLRIGLYKDGKQKLFFVHRLVAICFLENPNNYPFINHKDENPSNNRVDNLEWCTAEYNNNYGTRIDRFSKSNRKPIVQYSKNGSVIKRYDSLKSAAKETGISKCSISSCTKDDLKYAGGFLWAYENQGQDSVISERCRQKMNNKSYAKVYPYPKNLLCDMYYWEQNADEKMSFILSLSDEQIKAVSDEIDKAIEAKLDERMKRTIILRYKYNAKYREIGEEFGVKQERVRQIKNKAVRRIAKPVKEFVKQNWF